jgi:Tfp pilus assembly protein PilF
MLRGQKTQLSFLKTKIPNFSVIKISSLKSKNFCTSTSTSQQNPEYSQLDEVKNITEFKEGLKFLNEGKFQEAEGHLKECLKIFKNINQTETYSYMYIMKKYTQALFYGNKLEECEKMLKASIQQSKTVFSTRPELTFPFYRNILAFYTYTDISKASVLVDELHTDSGALRHKKYFAYAAGAIKLLNSEYSAARAYMSTTMEHGDLPIEYQAGNMHNLALLNNEMIRDCDAVEDEDLRTKWRKEFDFPNSKIAEKEGFVFYKQALAKYELEMPGIERSDKEKELLKHFLFKQDQLAPEELTEEEENLLVNSFKSKESGLTMTTLAETLFEKGKEYERHTAFWLKAGIKHYENYEKENIARHLIIFALFYSQLGQSMYAEGLYRKAIEILKNVKVVKVIKIKKVIFKLGLFF